MKEELNIAAILKDKPQGTKLYDLLYNVDVELDTISTTDTETVVWCTNETDNNTTCHRGYSEFGTIRGCLDGLQILLPSKEMRDWRKFDWKKGDVLVNSRGLKILFDRWANDNYTSFYAKTINLVEDAFLDTNLHTLASEKEAKSFIKCIEEKLGGKLNLETLEIEKQPKQEFKDGDILHSDETEYSDETIFIAKISSGVIGTYAYIDLLDESVMVRNDTFEESEINAIRLATDSEKQQLFDALAKEGKRWNPDTKQIEDLPKKCEFKPMDWCLMKDSTKYWELCQFAYTRKVHGTTIYSAVGGLIYYKCIPYNEETKHLLGTTDEWKGGNND